jgi:hypothetical protein
MTASQAEAARAHYNAHVFEHGCTTLVCAEARRLWHVYVESTGKLHA